MNIDGLIEDLEAQAYFASTLTQESQLRVATCKSLLVLRYGIQDTYLSFPLLGKDFIAGFQNRITRSSWVLIQDYDSLEPQDCPSQLQLSKHSMKSVIDKHLIGVALRLKISSSDSECEGYILKTFGKVIEFVSVNAKTTWVPINRIKYIVVDKLSMNNSS
jgi:hypothetical protein